MSRDDLYERYLSEAERFLKSEASTAQLVKQECDRCDRESTSARNMAGKKKAEIDRLAHQAQEAFSQLSKTTCGESREGRRRYASEHGKTDCVE